MSDTEQVNFRLPVELRDWLRDQKKRNRSSVTSEIVRAIQERRERVEFKPAGSIGEAA
ncbi:TPA: Arc family DNA-binding protein [Stenotrophomonas maltophilia]